MKKLIYLGLFLTGLFLLSLYLPCCNFQTSDMRDSMSLEGPALLPGSMTENGLGDEVSLATPWMGTVVDNSYFKEVRYEKYRDPENMKIPFWLKPVKYYAGPAWYQKEVTLPVPWEGKRVIIH